MGLFFKKQQILITGIIVCMQGLLNLNQQNIKHSRPKFISNSPLLYFSIKQLHRIFLEQLI
jgi:hypothetical protein